MARKRTIDPDSWTDTKLARLTIGAHFLWLGTVSIADDEGRLEWDSSQLKFRLFPGKNDVDIPMLEKLMSELEENDAITVYEVGGKKYACHRAFAYHQYVTRAIASKLPGPDGTFPQSYRKAPIRDFIRRSLALRYGCEPGGSLRDVKCELCDTTGSIEWQQRRDGTPGSWVGFGNLAIDHIVPESRGGSNSDPANFRLLCRRCNNVRGNAYDPNVDIPREIQRNPETPEKSIESTKSTPPMVLGTVLVSGMDTGLGAAARAPAPTPAYTREDPAAEIEEQSLDGTPAPTAPTTRDATSPGFSPARDFTHWFVMAALDARALPEHHRLDPALVIARESLETANALLATYGRAECETRAQRFLAACAARSIRRPPSIVALSECWTFREVESPDAAARDAPRSTRYRDPDHPPGGRRPPKLRPWLRATDDGVGEMVYPPGTEPAPGAYDVYNDADAYHDADVAV